MENNYMFSLEEDDCNDMFITQTPNECLLDQLESSQSEVKNYKEEGAKFIEPCCSYVNQVRGDKPIYEDISDDENDFQCSQKLPNFE